MVQYANTDVLIHLARTDVSVRTGLRWTKMADLVHVGCLSIHRNHPIIVNTSIQTDECVIPSISLGF